MPAAEFLSFPGRSGPFGALLDETARAAAELCDLAESFSPEAFLEERPSDDDDTASVRSILCHVLRACRGYANDIRGARGLEREPIDPDLAAPADFRPLLAEQVRYTEATVEPILDIDYAADLTEDLANVARFTEKVVRATYDEGPLRESLRARYGEDGLVELALAIASGQVFPVTKRALGYAKSCAQVEIRV